MAPMDSAYLPELSRVFNGEEYVLSWREIAAVLEDATTKPSLQGRVDRWLQEDNPSQLLSKTSPTFGQPNQTSEKLVESKTAAINVSPPSNEHYDINQIKDDAKWLSKQLDVDQLQALRSVVLEWQLRPQLHLQDGYSTTELASLRGIFDDNVAVNTDDWNTVDLQRDEDDFKTETARRRRILFIHFQEELGLATVFTSLAEQVYVDTSKAKVNIILQTNDVLGILVSTINNATQSPAWDVIDEDSEYLWSISRWHISAVLMKLTILCLRSGSRPSTDVLRSWINVLTDTRFLSELSVSPLLDSTHVLQLQDLMSLTTIAILDPASSLAQVSEPDEAFWLRDAELVGDLHTVLLHALETQLPSSVVPGFTWSILILAVYSFANSQKDRQSRQIDSIEVHDSATGRRDSFAGSTSSSIYDDVISSINQMSPQISSPAHYLLDCAQGPNHASEVLCALASSEVAGSSSVMTTVLSQLLQEVVLIYADILGYDAGILAPQISLLSPTFFCDGTPELVSPAHTFLHNDLLRDRLFETACARFPYEALPFLRLCRSLAYADVFDGDGTQFVAVRLKSLASYTQAAHGDFDNFHTIREDENLNLVALDNHVSITPQHNGRYLTNGTKEQSSMVIPADTMGEVISDSHPPIVRWQFQLSGLVLLGEWLDLYFEGTLQNVLSPYDSPDEVAAEVVWLFTRLVETTIDPRNTILSLSSRHQAALSILEEASTNLKRGRDITQTIFDLIEQKIQFYRRRPTNNFDTNLLCACIQFIRITLPLNPDRIWTGLGKSGLVHFLGGDSLLTAIVSGVEQFSGDYTLTRASSSLYCSLVQNALTQTRPNLRGNGLPRSAFSKLPYVTTVKNHSTVLDGMTQSMLDIFELMPHWTASSARQQRQTLTEISRTLDNILMTTYGSRDGKGSELTSCLAQSALQIMSRLRPESVADAKTSAIFRQLIFYLRCEETFSFSSWKHDHLHAVVNLASTVVLTSRSQSEFITGFETSLFDCASLLVRRLVVRQHAPVSPIPRLLATLIGSIATNASVTLLGSLGSTSCLDLINVLSLLDARRDIDLSIQTWDVLKNLISRSQQWLAVVLLTGSVPEKKSSSTDKDTQVYRGKLVVTKAIDKLRHIDTQDTQITAAVLGFVRQMQQDWSWTLDTLRTQHDLFSLLIKYVTSQESSDDSLRTKHNYLTALITDLCSVHLHYAKSKKDVSAMKMFLPLVEWLTKRAISVSSYNHSLHDNLRKNFSAKYGPQLEDFKIFRPLWPRSLNVTYYNISLLDAVLDGASAWRLEGNKVHQSFSAEVVRANTNLALFEAEITMLHAFQKLTIEHCTFFVQASEMQLPMVLVAEKCLIANTAQHSSERIFENLYQTRADMALTVTRKLAEQNVKGRESRGLLAKTWACAMARRTNWEQAILNDDLLYWRTMVATVLMALQFHLSQPYKPLASDHSSQSLLLQSQTSISEPVELTAVLVGQGIESLVQALQDQHSKANTKGSTSQAGIETSSSFVEHKDVALTINILQTVLRQPRLPEFSAQLSERLLSTGCVQATFRLYSWSHLLVEQSTNNDPLYAEYASQLLLSLSSLPTVAEDLAVSGILNRILTARVTQVLQKLPNGVSHVDKRPHAALLYRLWSENILGICLNLLHTVGGAVAAEVAGFLGQFPNQLALASRAFQPRPGEFITSSLAKEASSLALISWILERFRVAGPSAAVDPSTIMPLVGYDEHRKMMCEDIRDLTKMGVGALSAKIVPTSEAELKSLKNGSLVKKISKELEQAVLCLTREDDSETDKS